MKYLIKFYTIIIFSIIFSFNSLAAEKIKIGLVVPLSGENKDLGESILKSVRLAINDINDSRILIVPKDNQNNPDQTLEVSKELYDEGIKIIIGPVFKKNTIKLNQLNNDLIFLSFTNKIDNSEKNIISAGVNSISQFNAIKKFQLLNQLERTFLFSPNTEILKEIKTGVKKSKIKLKDKFFYDPDPTLITKQIENITRYRIRKQNLEDEIKRIENSDEVDKEKKLAQLSKLDTIGGINFDSVIIADFEEDLKSVATSL
ncbi:ABC transporter substrate-binding protein, partial [Candidatus Pelagibacter sp.]|nr:ABC transporter substrate-binding protein [Candidatus Pelagibacter sp.]